MNYYGFINESDQELEVYINIENMLTVKTKGQDEDNDQSTFYTVERSDIDKLIEAIKDLKTQIILND